MLTNEDKARIKSEEIYRDEVKKALSEKELNSFGKNFWKFINSSFGIWLLSTVVVGLVAYFYNDNKLQTEIAANNAATIQKLETEASNRLHQFRSALSNQDPSKIYYQNKELAYTIDGVLIVDGTISPRKPIYVFPEYKERTMYSLLYEIERLTNDKKQASIIKDARKALTNAQNTLLNMEDPPSFDFPIGQQVLQIALINPDALTADQRKLLAEYQEKKNQFEQGPLLEYRNRIKNELHNIEISLQNNAYLKEMHDN